MFDDDWDSEGAWADPDNEGEWGEPSNEEVMAMGEIPDQSNPLISPQVDRQIHSPSAKQASVPPSPMPTQQAQAPSLVGKFDAHGRPVMCCKMVMKNGKPVQITEWKTPSADEYNALMWQSKRIVAQGGVAAQNVPTESNAAATNEMVPLGAAGGKTSKVKLAAGLAVGAGVAWWAYNRYVK